MPFVDVDFTPFFDFFFTIFLVYHDLKQKKRCIIDVSKYAFTRRNLPESEEYI